MRTVTELVALQVTFSSLNAISCLLDSTFTKITMTLACLSVLSTSNKRHFPVCILNRQEESSRERDSMIDMNEERRIALTWFPTRGLQALLLPLQFPLASLVFSCIHYEAGMILFIYLLNFKDSLHPPWCSKHPRSRGMCSTD